MWTDCCFLGKVCETENDVGDIVRAIQYSDDFIFCNEKSVSAREFYQAAVTDYQPSIILEVKKADYAGQRFIKYYDEAFTVFKMNVVDSETIALTLERGIRHEHTTEGT